MVCDTVPNKTKDILDTFIFSLGQLRSIERFRTVETVAVAVETVPVQTVETKLNVRFRGHTQKFEK